MGFLVIVHVPKCFSTLIGIPCLIQQSFGLIRVSADHNPIFTTKFKYAVYHCLCCLTEERWIKLYLCQNNLTLLLAIPFELFQNRLDDPISQRHAHLRTSHLAWTRRSERVDLANDPLCQAGVDVPDRFGVDLLCQYILPDLLDWNGSALIDNGLYIGLCRRFIALWC